MKAAWLTDIHLNFPSRNAREDFYKQIVETGCDVIFITGDIADAISTPDILAAMREATGKNIYFVCGNHDYYHGDVNEMRDIYSNLPSKHIVYLTRGHANYLTSNTCLVGVDGWADGVYGDYKNSHVVLNDSRLIADLWYARTMQGIYEQAKNRADALLSKMVDLATNDAKHLLKQLIIAKRVRPKNIIVLTHVPPFEECCLWQGKRTGKDFLPFYASYVTGHVLRTFAKKYPEINFLVLCGHTHCKAEYQAEPNLLVKTGGAEYNGPEIQELIDIQ